MADLFVLSPPRRYAAQVLGKAATQEQLDELFSLHAAAHPVVVHDIVAEVEIRGVWWHNLKRTRVEILSSNPAAPTSRARLLCEGQALCSPADQWNRRLGVTIAFGRALKKLRAGDRQ